MGNFQLMCHSCNNQKAASTIDYRPVQPRTRFPFASRTPWVPAMDNPHPLIPVARI